MHGPAREVAFEALEIAAAPGQGEQARRGTQDLRQDLFVERILAAFAAPLVQELSRLVDEGGGLLGRAAQFAAVEVTLDGCRRVPARLRLRLAPM